jgi:hypothetical protein
MLRADWLLRKTSQNQSQRAYRGLPVFAPRGLLPSPVPLRDVNAIRNGNRDGRSAYRENRLIVSMRAFRLHQRRHLAFPDCLGQLILYTMPDCLSSSWNLVWIGYLAVFLRCLLLTYRFRYARHSRLEKQPNRRRQKLCYFRDSAPATYRFIFLLLR